MSANWPATESAEKLRDEPQITQMAQIRFRGGLRQDRKGKVGFRRHTISFIGESPRGEEDIPPEIISRFQELWELYWNSVGKKDAVENRNEWLFGAWFSSGKFPYSWAIEKFEAFVEVNDSPEPDHFIIELLAEKAEEDIVRTVRILARMIHGDREGWRVSGWVESAKKILSEAMKANGEAQEIAERVIHYLGRRGYVAFGELLG